MLDEPRYPDERFRMHDLHIALSPEHINGQFCRAALSKGAPKKSRVQVGGGKGSASDNWFSEHGSVFDEDGHEPPCHKSLGRVNVLETSRASGLSPPIRAALDNGGYFCAEKSSLLAPSLKPVEPVKHFQNLTRRIDSANLNDAQSRKRIVLKPALISSAKRFGSSHAAKCPPFEAWL